MHSFQTQDLQFRYRVRRFNSALFHVVTISTITLCDLNKIQNILATLKSSSNFVRYKEIGGLFSYCPMWRLITITYFQHKEQTGGNIHTVYFRLYPTWVQFKHVKSKSILQDQQLDLAFKQSTGFYCRIAVIKKLTFSRRRICGIEATG